MDDALGMGHAQGPRHLRSDLGHLPYGHGLVGHARPQGFPLQQFHDQVGRTVCGAAHVVDLHDVRMIQGRHGEGFLLKALEGFRLPHQHGGQDLDRHLAAQARIGSHIDLTHPPRAEFPDDLVGTQIGAGFQGHDNLASKH